MLFVGVDLDPDAPVTAQAQEVVDDLEAQRPVRVVDAANVAEHVEAALPVVAQKAERNGQRFALDPDAQLAAPNLAGDDDPRQRRR